VRGNIVQRTGARRTVVVRPRFAAPLHASVDFSRGGVSNGRAKRFGSVRGDIVQSTANTAEGTLPVLVRPTHARQHKATVLSVLCVLLLPTLLGCGSGHGKSAEEGPDRLPECETYIASYRACTGIGLGADDRVSALRTSLAAPADKARRERLRTRCMEATQSLRAACQ
jgi:hypothetical protein